MRSGQNAAIGGGRARMIRAIGSNANATKCASDMFCKMGGWTAETAGLFPAVLQKIAALSVVAGNFKSLASTSSATSALVAKSDT
jgi:hypothetical protein